MIPRGLVMFVLGLLMYLALVVGLEGLGGLRWTALPVAFLSGVLVAAIDRRPGRYGR